MTYPLVNAFIMVFDTVLSLYFWVVILSVVASWLLAFGVLNLRNDLARQLVHILDALTDPVFRRIRKVIPPIGGLDLSPLIVVIAIQIVQYLGDSYLGMLRSWTLN
ncbi:MAG TPA: YggT family protein [Rhizomicrobium sp.]|nr:YggT family protein [Rhizomicrobium sp.]